jgi:hypothetical protein
VRDLRTYINQKYGYDLEYLPVWEKVMRGDVSDGIPNVCPRMTTLVHEAVMRNKDHQDIEEFIADLKINSTKLEEKFGAEIYDKLRINYKIVMPKYQDISTLKLRRVG